MAPPRLASGRRSFLWRSFPASGYLILDFANLPFPAFLQSFDPVGYRDPTLRLPRVRNAFHPFGRRSGSRAIPSVAKNLPGNKM
jgi:hypothetical protein